MALTSSLIRQQIPLMPTGPLSQRSTIVNANVLEDIPKLTSQWSSGRILLVASRSLAKNQSTVQDLQKALGSTLAATKLGVGSHSPYADVLDVARLLQKHDADALVCIGTSSYSDACKAARLLAATLPPNQLTVEGINSIMDFKKGRTKSGALKDPKAKLILVPCSLSASEYNPVSSATDPNGKKEHFGDGVHHLSAAADYVLLDPAVAATVPENIWLESGARAIDHCVESIVSKATQDEGVKIALEALSALIFGLQKYKTCHTRKAANDDVELLEAISACQVGARKAISTIICYGSKMGPSHAIGHQLGSVGHVAHGLTSCVCLAGVLRYEKRHADSRFWNVPRHEDVLKAFNRELGWEESEAGEAVERFYRSLGLATRLKEVGVTSEKAIRQIAEQTLTDIWGNGEPQMTKIEEVLEVLDDVR